MVRRFRVWMREVFVPDWLIWLAIGCALFVWLIPCLWREYFVWKMAVAVSNLSESELFIPRVPPLLRPALLVAAVLYGLLRAVVYHPVHSKKYGTWLAQTPWRFPQRLPMGPVFLVWQDVVAIAAIMAAGLLPPRGEISVVHFPVAFLFAYCAAMAVVFLRLEMIWIFSALLLLAACGIMLSFSPWALLLTALAAYGVTYLGIARSLRDFPYTDQERKNLGLLPYELQPPPLVALPIIPTSDYHRDARALVILQKYGAVAAALVGIAMFCVAWNCRTVPNFERGLLLAHRVIAAIIIFGRLSIYLVGHYPPISLLGRIATRRFIIPGSDMMFVAPLTAGLVAFFGPELLLGLGISTVIAVPVATAATVWAALTLPPDLDTWHYTGHFRIPPVTAARRELVRA